MIKKITLIPSRIGCPSIPGAMMGVLKSMSGVHGVDIHYDERSLDVTLDDEKISAEDIIKKVGEEMGLALKVKTEGAKEGENHANTCPL
ncbi:heavy-metal-associated domain-containing protein [bacterium]|nr:heavy-metal-associated domain-containing protein [bacterium]